MRDDLLFSVGVIARFVFSIMFVLLFGSHGVAVVLGVFAGLDIVQMYRFVKTKYGCKLIDMLKMPQLFVKYASTKENIFNSLAYVLGIIVGFILRQL